MSDRIQLNEENLEDVVGGAFHFYNNRITGEKMCMVDGIGMFKATNTNSVENVMSMCAANGDKTQEELANMAVSRGYLVRA